MKPRRSGPALKMFLPSFLKRGNTAPKSLISLLPLLVFFLILKFPTGEMIGSKSTPSAVEGGKLWKSAAAWLPSFLPLLSFLSSVVSLGQLNLQSGQARVQPQICSLALQHWLKLEESLDLPTCWRIPGEVKEEDPRSLDRLNIRLRFRFRGCQVFPAVGRRSSGQSV